ncbi:hypothetical protein LguiB_032173 [Lonicera macranthoides]
MLLILTLCKTFVLLLMTPKLLVYISYNLDIIFVNGKFSTDPKLDKANDFFFSDLCNTGNTSNPVGSVVTPANVVQIPGLNILGISLVRIDHAPNNLNPPHIHSRPVEALVVLDDTLYLNVGKTKAVTIAALSRQNPGVITIANAVFGSNPPISPDVLTKAFQVDKNVIDHLLVQF